MREEDMARVEEESRDPNEDNDDRVYQQYRERWEWKTAKEFGAFEDRSKFDHISSVRADFFGSVITV
jgi:hypothetical protein